MRSLVLMMSLAAALVTGCAISIVEPGRPNLTPVFVTATLPDTRTPYASRTPVVTVTPTIAGLTGTAAANCKEAAVLLQDVTIPDGTNIPYGVKFTKTWQFRNTGTCPWSGYSIAFVSGDRMGTPDSAPVPGAAPKATVNVSVDLVAPTTDGAYTGFYELRTSAGKALAIGTLKTFWVKITVGNVGTSTPAAATGTAATATGASSTPQASNPCNPTVSGSYPGQIVTLINQARTGAGLQALAVNAQLATAAQNHSVDMACSGQLSHTGSDGSSIHDRLAAAGYNASYSEEMIYGGDGATPQNAFDWWMNDAAHHAIIFDTRVTAIGAGFAYVANSAYGDYYTVDVAKP